jgi:hypothetical protein
MTQKQSEKQAWQKTVCQDREQHATITMARIGRTEQCLSDSPSSTSSLENCSDTAISTSALANTITALSTNSNHLGEQQPQLLLIEAKIQGFQGTGINTIDKLTMDRWGPVTHHHTRKETLLPNKVTIKALEVAAPLKEQAHSLIHDALKSLAGRRLFSKIGTRWECKSKSQCKDMLQIALSTCIPCKKCLKPMNIPSHFGRMTQNNLAKALLGHFKKNPNQQDDPTMVPNRTKWHQQTYQRLPGKEQGYSLRWLGC